MRNNRSSSLPTATIVSENDVLTPNKLFWNYLIFCLLYSSAHGTVDAVLAFSSAELGSTNGSNGGFILYIFYTSSALLLAKPVLGLFGPKSSVLFGLVGMLCYVASFFMALQSHTTNDDTAYIFMFGAVFGGIGAGFLAAKIVSPYLPKLDLGLGSFGQIDSQAIESRIVEIAVVGGVLYGLQQAKIINISSNKSDLMTLAATILVADMLGEELLPFIGYKH